nr:MAG TPA: hypothetical protein [Caudoviricetes sp.]
MKLSEERVEAAQIQTGTAMWYIDVVNNNLHLCDTETNSFDVLIDDIDEAITYLKYAKKSLLKEKKK